MTTVTVNLAEMKRGPSQTRKVDVASLSPIPIEIIKDSLEIQLCEPTGK